jgi:hypothetical protein
MTLYMRAPRTLPRRSVRQLVFLVCVLFIIFDVCQVLRYRASLVAETRPAPSDPNESTSQVYTGTTNRHYGVTGTMP